MGDEIYTAPPAIAGLQAISLEDFLATEIPAREFLLEPWLPSQGVAMVYAARGLGKTFFALGVAYAVASGGQFLNWQAPQPRRVLYIDGEMPAAAMQERLCGICAASEADAPAGYFHIATPDFQPAGLPDLSGADGQSEVNRLLDGVSLLVLDNVSCLFRG